MAEVDREKVDIGVIDLEVMSQNIALNMSDHNFTVVCFNRTTSRFDDFF